MTLNPIDTDDFASQYATKKSFPFNVYHINNIKCRVNMIYGSTLNLMTSLYMSNNYFNLVIPFIGYEKDNSNYLIKLEQGSEVVKSINSEDKFDLSFSKGTFYFDSISFKYGGFEIDTSLFVFPLYNMNLVSNVNTKLIFGKSANIDGTYKESQTFVLYPNSNLNLNGETIIYKGSVIVDVDYKEYTTTQYEEWLGFNNSIYKSGNYDYTVDFKKEYNISFTIQDASNMLNNMESNKYNYFANIYGDIKGTYVPLLNKIFNVNGNNDNNHLNITNLNKEISTGNIYSNYYSLEETNTLDSNESFKFILFLDSLVDNGVCGFGIPMNIKLVF